MDLDQVCYLMSGFISYLFSLESSINLPLQKIQ